MPYTHFTTEERQKMQEMLNAGKNFSEIARELNRHRSSVTREYKRNSDKNGKYSWWRVLITHVKRRERSVRKLRLKEAKVRMFVVEGFEKRWSPEIIVQRYKKENPEEALSHNTIYKAIKNKEFPDVTAKTHLRRRGRRKNARKAPIIKPVHTIHDRPPEVETRERIGDLEGDTVHGSMGNGCLVTLVDRQSRFLYAALAKSRDSGMIVESFEKALGDTLVNSITLDNGTEFAKFAQIEKNHGTTVYFADPHSPWQRGSNENLNGLIRFFFPKGTNFLEVSEDEVLSVVFLINTRPRKCLDWLSPAEFLQILNKGKLSCT